MWKVSVKVFVSLMCIAAQAFRTDGFYHESHIKVKGFGS